MQLLQNKKALRYIGLFFLASSATWLFAPGITHELRIGPNLISEYESTAWQYGWVFRLFDGLSALTLLSVALSHKQRLTKRWGAKAWLVLSGIAAFALLDALVPVNCTLADGLCSPDRSLGSIVHGVESMLLGTTVAAFSIYIAWRYRVGRWFVAVQILSLLLGFVLHKHGQHWLFAVQAGYQMIQAYWIYSLVFTDTQPVKQPSIFAQAVRSGLALWVAVNGVIALILSWNHVTLGHINSLAFLVGSNTWLLGHTLFIGLLLLYLARQLWLGERRAYVLTNIVLLSELLRWSITHHGQILIVLIAASLLVLIHNRDVFDRHGSFVGFTSRLKFLAVGLAVSISVITLGTLAFRMHNHREWVRSPYDVARVVRRVALLEISSDHQDSIRIHLLDRLLTILGASTYLWVIVGIFLPSKSFHKQDYESHTILKMLRLHSSSSEDYFKLWPADKQYYETKAGSLIAYGEHGGYVVALAHPIGTHRHRRRDIEEFKAYCRAHGLKSSWLLVDDASKQQYENAGYKLLMIGSSAVISVAEFCTETVRNKWWRWQMNRAGKAGNTYQLLQPPFGSKTIDTLRHISDAWLERPGHVEQTFAAGFFNEAYIQQCRLHCLYDSEGTMIAFANEPPIFGGQQTTVDMIRFIPGTDGAMSVLISHALQQLQSEGIYTYFDLGFVPLANIDSAPAKTITKLLAKRFSAEGLSQFKNKFDPHWQRNYLAYDGDVVDLAKGAFSLNKILEYKREREQT